MLKTNLHEEIQKGIADLMSGRVRCGKQVLEDLAFTITVKQCVVEIQEGKALPLEEAKKHLKLK